MKKNIILLSFLLMLLSFFYGIQIFNTDSQNRALYFLYGNRDTNYVMIEISEIQYDIDNSIYSKKLNEILLKNSLVGYELTEDISEETGSRIMNLSITSNGNEFANQVYLQKGIFDISEEDIEYSSFSNDPNTTLANLNSPNEYYVRNMTQKKEYGGLFYLTTTSGSLMGNTEQFIRDMQQIYPDFQVRLEEPFEKNIILEQNVFTNEIFSIACVLTLILSSLIFSKMKEIALKKMEGHSNFEIYLEYFIKPFIFYSLCMLAIIVLCSFMTFPESVTTWMGYLKIISYQFLLICIIEIMVSLALYVLISFFPICISIRGKNNLKELQIVTYFMKIGVSVLLIPAYLLGVSSLIDSVTIMRNHSTAISGLKNLYQFGPEVHSEYFNFEERQLDDQVIAVRNDFIENNHVFYMTGGFLSVGEGTTNMLPVLFADDQYVLQNDLITDDLLLENSIVFVREDTKLSDELISQYIDALKSDDPSNIVNVIKYDKDLLNYRSVDLLYNPLVNDKVIIYSPFKEFAVRLNGSMFNYDKTNVQSYVDSVFKKHGFSAPFKISKVQTNYESTYRYRINYNSKFIFPIFALLISYLLVSKLFIDIDYQASKKKYFIRKIEGYSRYSISEYFLKSITPILLALILLRITNKVLLIESTYSIFIMILFLETMTYLFSQFIKHRKKGD